MFDNLSDLFSIGPCGIVALKHALSPRTKKDELLRGELGSGVGLTVVVFPLARADRAFNVECLALLDVAFGQLCELSPQDNSVPGGSVRTIVAPLVGGEA